MILFATDLDNTLIYSQRRDIGEKKVPVELYEGRQVSFMTKQSQELLLKLKDQIEIVPLTTRSTQQYERICFAKEWSPTFALTGNGGTLLYQGREDMQWTEETKRLIAPCAAALDQAQMLLEKEEDRILDVRRVNGLFVFTKSGQPEKTLQRLREQIDSEDVTFHNNKEKVYVVPKALNKATALRRLQEYLKPRVTYAAGDSDFDIEMLRAADHAFAPRELAQRSELKEKELLIPREGEIFSDYLLKFLQNR